MLIPFIATSRDPVDGMIERFHHPLHKFRGIVRVQSVLAFSALIPPRVPRLEDDDVMHCQKDILL